MYCLWALTILSARQAVHRLRAGLRPADIRPRGRGARPQGPARRRDAHRRLFNARAVLELEGVREARLCKGSALVPPSMSTHNWTDLVPPSESTQCWTDLVPPWESTHTGMTPMPSTSCPRLHLRCPNPLPSTRAECGRWRARRRG